MSVELYLARRHLMDRRHGAWGWLITLIATGSVALGVAALIVTLAIMTGFREDIQEKMLGVNPHIFISSFTGQLNPHDTDLVKKLSEDSVVMAWSPFISGQVLIGRGKHNSGATIKGIDPIREQHVANLEGKLVKGKWDDLMVKKTSTESSHPNLILGQELARQIAARVGDTVWVVTPNSIGLTALSIPKAQIFQVSGIVHTGLYDYDLTLIYTDLSSAQKLFGMGRRVTGIGVKTDDVEDAEATAAHLRKSLEGIYWVRSWLSQNKNLFSALKLEKIVMFLILAMLTVVAAFMIVSNLLLTILQKTREIGILRAMGATTKTIHKTFLYQGMLMGLVGNLVGAILGIGVSLILKETNIINLPAGVYYIDQLPIRLMPLDIIFVVCLAAIIVLLATLFPSHKAAKLDPLDAIRYG